ncbi:RluA family pseudouridine synthase [Comamonadaceae bacterium OH2545_COT-014]|nr:RluA family pseudouridine synthase [Comamonadaceae bacterium OH2545_COT-014]
MPPGDDLADAPEEAQAEQRQLIPPARLHGERLDRALAALVPEFSRSYLSQLVTDGAVTLAGRPAAKPAQRVKAGEAITVLLRPTPQAQAFTPQPIPLAMLHEDEHLAIVHKPAGLVVHPAPGHWSGTLLNGLLAHNPAFARLPRAGIVHRLDKDTSGLMAVAKSRPAMDALVAAIAAREVRREYLALAHRPWQGAPTREVTEPIGRDPRHRQRMAVVDLARHPGKPAHTTFTLLHNAASGCLVHARLGTGRTHQIRVHMAHLGHPLVADALYGGAPAAGLARQALHAWQLALTHPATGAPLAFKAPLPADMAAALAAWEVPAERF